MLGQAVIKLQAKALPELQAYYKTHLVPKLPPGALFRAETESCAITAYQSGKVLFQGKAAEHEAEKWAKDNQQVTTSAKTSSRVEQHGYTPPNNIEELAIIGSDEVGTGDYFGPLVVAAVYVDQKNADSLRQLGVRDSKTLTDERINRIAEQILPLITSSVLVLPNEKYNALQSSGYNQNKLKAIMHNQALLNVQNKLDHPFDGFLIDQFTTPLNYFKLLADRQPVIKERIYFKTKGENVHLSVACASIISRQRFLIEMDRLSDQCGQILPKGAGPHVDIIAAQIINTQGIDILKKLTKFHFSNTEKALKISR